MYLYICAQENLDGYSEWDQKIYLTQKLYNEYIKFTSSLALIMKQLKL